VNLDTDSEKKTFFAFEPQLGRQNTRNARRYYRHHRNAKVLLVNELKLKLSIPKKSGTINNVEELVHEASNIYGDITVDQKKTNPPK
jgi:hypothetical protein